ncbi:MULTISPECIES: TIGR04283 family arsenosugar biosynthesis glycosyltransferase [unclassified Coleofasciculus]|uniref:TIGR04283 family arsenosugar biosynthesis glycosyltransferase n=1 Tax=unclassified Coleofasciculus TaxID=2692782 RepID=UPI0018814D83|nr:MULTISPECIES: TIGR04283 family arsenosugar biosynthesis glycosyltransferase [unclassified Coleofasciculus]MBE9128566.1 TIGR04283 family arsenosugar biosynthesis glycosyltransferase [Coleofasciculus sp. LEGE 07081]MBE9149354.1 TIGR04283 family arsenosugar biosynthesis glycosyltransferase [Coleofasciculus sp. LEGE 07092]
MNATKISIIIPTLNEAITLQETLIHLKDIAGVEIIVADGGSQDETVEIARSLGGRVIVAPAGRASQMNAGAGVATGDIFLFLHADTRLPSNFDILVRQALQYPTTIVGAFELRIDAQIQGLRLVEKMVNMRSHFLGMPYGDQAIFLKATVFHDISGFPDLPIMEDFELIRRLRRLGKIAIIPAPVLTSGRRWEKLGVVKTTLINQVIIAGYFLGVPPTRLVQWYRGR